MLILTKVLFVSMTIWCYDFRMKTFLISGVVNNSFGTVWIFDCIRPFGDDNIHTVNIFQFSVFRKFFTIRKLLADLVELNKKIKNEISTEERKIRHSLEIILKIGFLVESITNHLKSRLNLGVWIRRSCVHNCDK